MHISSRAWGEDASLTRAGRIPAPSDEVLIRLATIATQVEDALAFDTQPHQAPVGLRTIKNDRRRAMEAMLVLLADPEVRDYLAELERAGLLPVKR